jgi:hypothetical protein
MQTHWMHRSISLLLGLLLAVCLVPVAAHAQTVPTDGLQLRLEADAVQVADGEAVEAWTDQSAYRQVLEQSNEARRPTYVADAINGKPVVRFDDEDGFDASTLRTVLSPGSGYTVVRVTRQDDRGYLSVAEGTVGADEAETLLSRFLTGQVAEVLVYNRRLTDAEKETVSDVLGQRYALESGATAARSGGTDEGVRVRGSWTITVRNPDGSLDERQSFENAFENAALLSDIVASTASVGVWRVEVDAGTGTQPCEGSGGADEKCRIIEEGDDSANWIFPGLNVTSPDSGDDANSTVLQGSFTAANDSDVSRVFTNVGSCDASTAPDNCPDISSVPFTIKDLSSTVPVSVGQQVSVRVVISFD